jgi:hypothetical protein
MKFLYLPSSALRHNPLLLKQEVEFPSSIQPNLIEKRPDHKSKWLTT